MRILAIESASKTASAAILEDDVLIAEYTTNHKITHSQTLLPMIDEICKRTEQSIADFDAIAISKGPGSYTGLRIGSATAKGIGLALDKPLIEVPTLEGLAYNVQGIGGLICPMMDARRDNVFTAVYRFDGDKITQVMQECLIAVSELVEKLAQLGENVTFLGDGIGVYRAVLVEGLADRASFANPAMSTHRAGSVAVAAAKRFENQEFVRPEKHVPDYLRPSQAERAKGAE